MPLPKDISLLIPVHVDHEEVLPSHEKIRSPRFCFQHLNPCAENLVHNHSSGCADHKSSIGAFQLFLLLRRCLTTSPHLLLVERRKPVHEVEVGFNITLDHLLVLEY